MANYQVLVLFGILLLLSSLSALATKLWNLQHAAGCWYLDIGGKRQRQQLISIWIIEARLFSRCSK